MGELKKMAYDYLAKGESKENTLILVSQAHEGYPIDQIKKAVDDAYKAIRKQKQIAYGVNYDKRNTKRFSLKFNLVHDADILEKLACVKTMQGYIKDLIRADIAKNGM